MSKISLMALASFFLLSATYPTKPPAEKVNFHCGLPAPKNVHWEAIGSSMIQLTWDPVPGAAFYKAYLYRGNLLIQQRLVVAHPTRNFVYLDGFGNPQITYVIKSVCANNMESNKTP